MKCAIGVLALVIATAWALDLDAIHRSSQRGMRNPMNMNMNMIGTSSVEKRRSHDFGVESKAEEEAVQRLASAQYNRMMSARMQELLQNLMAAEANQEEMVPEPRWMEVLRQAKMAQMEIQPPYDQEDIASAYGSGQGGGRVDDMYRWASSPALPRVPLRPEYAYDKRNYRTHKQLPSSVRVPQDEFIKKRSVEGKTTSKPQVTTPSASSKTPLSSAQKSALHAQDKKPVKAAEVDAKRNKRDMITSENKTAADEYKQWLTEEYYRNMAMNYATMRKKRSIDDTPEKDQGVAFDKLKQMEQTLLQEALALVQQGGNQGDTQKLKAQVSDRLDVAHDIESLKKALQRLYLDSEKLKEADEAQLLPKAAAGVKGNQEVVEDDRCPELDMLSSGCTALDGMFPPGPVQEQFLMSCNWHEVCYACGAQHGMNADQCDQAFLMDMKVVCSQLGSCNKQMVQLLLEPLHKKRIYFKRSSPPICERPCVSSFLARSK